jgi:esterase/lipase superfamily enzyme
MEVSGTVLIALIALAVVSYVSYRWGFSREGLAPTASPELPAPSVTSKPRVFISYRRTESARYVSALHDRLSAALGRAQVFTDVDSIPAGSDFTDSVRNAIARSDVMLVVIGDRWLTETNTSGVRRIDDPHDSVRNELEAALQRGIPVIPVLVRGGKAPRASELPPTLSQIANYLAIPISEDSFHRDLDDLIQRLQRFASYPIPAAPPKPESPQDGTHKPPAGIDSGKASVPPKRHAQSNIYRTWFGTNRQPVTRTGAVVGFSSSRDTQTHYGICEVTIPKAHKIGSTGSPLWKRILTLTDDRLKVIRVDSMSEDVYWTSVEGALKTVGIDERDAVVFIHGYNVSFEEAALRAAQIGYDLGIAGVMAFYSWPSKGSLDGYPADEASIEASEGFIADFLTRMATTSGAARVHIIAHSMGNRGLLRAIDRIATTAAKESRVPFNQIILAAADVDRDTFARLSVAYRSVAQRTTMYVCARDRAVEASHWLHDYPRAGLAPPVLVVPGIDTINVSNLDLTLLGHGYVAEARDVLQDMHRLIREGSPPERRFGLRREVTPEGATYWMVGA